MLRRQLVHFAIAGSLGFGVDAALVQGLVGLAGADPYLARFPAVAAAILTTFAYNRGITFADRRSPRVLREFLRYLLSCSAGLVANYAAYVAVLATWSGLRVWPVAGVAAGSIAGMAVNFLAARYFVFARGSSPDAAGRRSG